MLHIYLVFLYLPPIPGLLVADHTVSLCNSFHQTLSIYSMNLDSFRYHSLNLFTLFGRNTQNIILETDLNLSCFEFFSRWKISWANGRIQKREKNEKVNCCKTWKRKWPELKQKCPLHKFIFSEQKLQKNIFQVFELSGSSFFTSDERQNSKYFILTKLKKLQPVNLNFFMKIIINRVQ